MLFACHTGLQYDCYNRGLLGLSGEALWCRASEFWEYLGRQTGHIHELMPHLFTLLAPVTYTQGEAHVSLYQTFANRFEHSVAGNASDLRSQLIFGRHSVVRKLACCLSMVYCVQNRIKQ